MTTDRRILSVLKQSVWPSSWQISNFLPVSYHFLPAKFSVESNWRERAFPFQETKQDTMKHELKEQTKQNTHQQAKVDGRHRRSPVTVPLLPSIPPSTSTILLCQAFIHQAKPAINIWLALRLSPVAGEPHSVSTPPLRLRACLHPALASIRNIPPNGRYL